MTPLIQLLTVKCCENNENLYNNKNFDNSVTASCDLTCNYDWNWGKAALQSDTHLYKRAGMPVKYEVWFTLKNKYEVWFP